VSSTIRDARDIVEAEDCARTMVRARDHEIGFGARSWLVSFGARGEDGRYVLWVDAPIGDGRRYRKTITLDDIRRRDGAIGRLVRDVEAAVAAERKR
jgi:hypothetical protein